MFPPRPSPSYLPSPGHHSGTVHWMIDGCTRNLQVRTGITASLWSVLLVLFLITSCIVLGRFGLHRKVRLVLTLLLITFIIATVEFGLNIRSIHSQTPTLIAHPKDLHCLDNDQLYLRVPMVLEMFIGDAFTIYRTWLLWDQRLLPIIFPAVLLFVLGQWIILMSVTSIVTYPVVIPVSLALNIACLILIAYRLYTHPKLPLPRLFIHTMISTSCLYIILLFYFMITIFTRWHYAIALAGPISITTVIALSLNLLVLQACLPGAFTSEGMIQLTEHGLVGLEPMGTDTTFPTDPIIDIIMFG